MYEQIPWKTQTNKAHRRNMLNSPVSIKRYWICYLKPSHKGSYRSRQFHWWIPPTTWEIHTTVHISQKIEEKEIF